MHVGVDSKSKLLHSVATSAASVADKHMLPDLLHGEEKKVWGDGAYQGQSETIRQAAPMAQDMTIAGRSLRTMVCHECVGLQRDAVSEMEVGPPESAYRGRFQTAVCG